MDGETDGRTDGPMHYVRFGLIYTGVDQNVPYIASVLPRKSSFSPGVNRLQVSHDLSFLRAMFCGKLKKN